MFAKMAAISGFQLTTILTDRNCVNEQFWVEKPESDIYDINAMMV